MSVPRWQAEVGETVRLQVRFEQQETLIDPFLISGVVIEDPDGNVVATIAAGWVQVDTGIYYVDWAIPAGSVAGVYHDKWTWTPYSGYPSRTGTNAINVFPAGTFTVDEAYLTAAQLKSEGYVDAATTLTDAQLGFLARLATNFFERAAGRTFFIHGETLEVDGTGAAYLNLKTNETIRSIQSVTDRDSGTAIAVAELRFRGSRIFHQNFRAWPHRRGDNPPPWQGCGAIFPRGIMNIRIVLNLGDFTTVPELVRHACGIMVGMAAQEDTVTAPWIQNYLSDAVDGKTQTMRDMDPGSRKKAMTGIPEVDAVINQYRRRRGRVASLRS